MKKGIFLLIILGLLILPLGSSLTYKKGEAINLGVGCENSGSYCSGSAVCNITIFYPNGSLLVENIGMNNQVSYFNYSISEDKNQETGEYNCIVMCSDNGINGTSTFKYEVTLSGKDPDASNPMVSLGIIALIFGIACVFLFISSQLQEAGPKIFFLLASFVFMIGSLAVTYVIAFESNLASQINSTVTIMLYAFGLIFFVIFAYIMIKQIVASVDLYRQNKGYEMEY